MLDLPYMKQKTASLIVGIVLLIIIGVAGYAYGVQHEKDETAKTFATEEEEAHLWPTDIDAESKITTYSNSDLGFSFSYPIAWGEPVFTTSKGVTGEAFNLSFPNKMNVTAWGTTKDYVADHSGDQVSDYSDESFYSEIGKGSIPKGDGDISAAILPVDGPIKGTWIIPVHKGHQATGFLGDSYIAMFKLKNNKYPVVNFNYYGDGDEAHNADIIYLVNTVTFDQN